MEDLMRNQGKFNEVITERRSLAGAVLCLVFISVVSLLLKAAGTA